MSRSFNGSSDKLVGSTWNGSLPLAVSAWFNADSMADMTIFAEANGSYTDRYLELRLTSAGKVEAASSFGGTERVAVTTTSYSTGQWHHALAVFAASNDRRVYLDGGGKGTNTLTLGTITTNSCIGVREASTPTNFFDGILAEIVAIEDTPTDEQAAMWAAGFDPKMVMPWFGSVYNAPLIGASPEIDLGYLGMTWTVTGTTVSGESPPIFYPSTTQVAPGGGGAAPAVVQYRRRLISIG